MRFSNTNWKLHTYNTSTPYGEVTWLDFCVTCVWNLCIHEIGQIFFKTSVNIFDDKLLVHTLSIRSSASLFLSPGQQLRQSSTLHLRVQHPQRPTTTIANPDPLSSSHLILPPRVSHTSLRRWRRGWTGQPRDHEEGQAHLEHPRGKHRWEEERGQPTPVPTSTLPLWAVPGLTRGRPQSRPLRSHGDVDLRGGCGLQPWTL